MSLTAKKYIIGILGLLFLASLVVVQFMEAKRKTAEIPGARPASITVPANSQGCVKCHQESSPGIIDHWKFSTHAAKGIGCVECHQAKESDVDGFNHYGTTIATIVTPLDCSKCHKVEYEEFTKSHHAKGGNILASLDNHLAETVEGNRAPFNPHGPTPGREFDMVNGMASVNSGCKQCHGSKVALKGKDGALITLDDLKPDEKGNPTNETAVANIFRDANGRPTLDSSSWPNSGIGRLNLDGSRGSCSACHSRHDFSPRRARQPENCGKCHLGPDHPQKEVYEESKHGVAFRDLHQNMNLDADKWVLGEDYSQAPTCATCHMSGHSKNGGKVTHDPAERISWTNRPPISTVMDTNAEGEIVKETDPAKRQALIKSSWAQKRQAMEQVCLHCHTPQYVQSFYQQYDDFIVNYNEKFAKPGQSIMNALSKAGMLTKTQFDEEIEWTWYYLWHHEGRRARHGASMMAPDYAHWHGMYEVAERFYRELIPQAREIVEKALENGKKEEAEKVHKVIDDVLARPEHQWYQKEKAAREKTAEVLSLPEVRQMIESAAAENEPETKTDSSR